MMRTKIAKSLESKVLSNGGRWCTITMKATGEELTISRTGFRSFEDALYDSFCVKDSNGVTIAEADTLWGIADWIQSKYC